MMTQLYSSVTVSNDSVTVSLHAQKAQCKLAIVIFIIYSCAFPAVRNVYMKKRPSELFRTVSEQCDW